MLLIVTTIMISRSSQTEIGSLMALSCLETTKSFYWCA